jgi:hypothetical protein
MLVALAVINNFSPVVKTREQLKDTVSFAATVKSERILFAAVAVVPTATLTVPEEEFVLHAIICLTIVVVEVGTKYLPVESSVAEVTAAAGPKSLFCVNAITKPPSKVLFPRFLTSYMRRTYSMLLQLLA